MCKNLSEFEIEFEKSPILEMPVSEHLNIKKLDRAIRSLRLFASFIFRVRADTAGRKEGRREGRKEGRKEDRREGRKEGRKEGRT